MLSSSAVPIAERGQANLDLGVHRREYRHGPDGPVRTDSCRPRPVKIFAKVRYADTPSEDRPRFSYLPSVHRSRDGW